MGTIGQPITINALPPELLLETFQHLTELEPLGSVDDFEDDEVSEIASPTSSIASNLSETSVDDDYTDSELLTGAESSTWSQSTWSPYSLGWTRVTHVCSLWRRVAISTPSLWSSIPLNLPPKWVDELLRRSNQVPLDLTIPESPFDDSHIAALLSRINIHRIRRIVCEKPHDVPVLELLGNNLAGGANNTVLEELVLAGISPRLLTLNAFKALRRVDITLRDDDPTLDELSRSIHLPSLTELRFRLATITETMEDIPLPVSDHWFALLDNLTILELVPVPFNFNGRGEIVLPRLRELIIEEDSEFCGMFLQHVRMPFLNRYDVQYFRPDYPATTDLAMVKAMGFSRAFDDADATAPALHTLTISHFFSFYSHIIDVHAWRSVEQDDDTVACSFDDTRMAPMNATISHSFDLDTEGTPIRLSNFATVLLSHPSLSTLCLLSLELHPALELGDATLWANLLQPMRHLRHLRISSPWSPRVPPLYILEALRSRHVGDEYVAPSLKRLSLVDWDPDIGATSIYGVRAGEVLRGIARERAHATSLEAVHIVSWRRCYDAEWQGYLEGVDGVDVLYEHLFLPLSHVHVTEDSDVQSTIDLNAEPSYNGLQAVPYGLLDAVTP